MVMENLEMVMEKYFVKYVGTMMSAAIYSGIGKALMQSLNMRYIWEPLSLFTHWKRRSRDCRHSGLQMGNVLVRCLESDALLGEWYVGYVRSYLTVCRW